MLRYIGGSGFSQECWRERSQGRLGVSGGLVPLLQLIELSRRRWFRH
jgi:hypothetical protein